MYYVLLTLDLGRKIFRTSLNRRATDASVKEEDNEEEDDDDYENENEKEQNDNNDQVGLPQIMKQNSSESKPTPSKPFLQRLTQTGTLSKITIISPSLLSNSPLPEKKVSKSKPKPLLKSATVSPSGTLSTKLIRQTLKDLHDNSPENSPVITHRKSAKMNEIMNPPHFSSSPSLPNELNPEKKVFHRNTTDSIVHINTNTNFISSSMTNSNSNITNSISQTPLPIVSQSRSISDDDIPGPPSEPPPKDSPDIGRKRLDSGKFSLY